MKNLTIVYSYYRNLGMLALHYETWSGYPDAIKQRIECVIVDDGSPEPALDVPRPDGLPELRIYRIPTDKPWNQHAARNWGVHHASKDWVFMSDMDHLLPATSVEAMLAHKNKEQILKFRRLDAPDLKPKLKDGVEHPHPNTFAMTRRMYWTIGGYDEDFCGIYGTDGLFISRASSAGDIIQTDIPIIRYSREVIPDASTWNLPRKEGRDPHAKQRVRERKKVENLPVRVLTDECVRVL